MIIRLIAGGVFGARVRRLPGALVDKCIGHEKRSAANPGSNRLLALGRDADAPGIVAIHDEYMAILRDAN